MLSTDLPQSIVQALLAVKTKYELMGWTALHFGRPDSPIDSQKRVAFHGTSPLGVRVHANFDETEDVAYEVEVFLKSNSG